MVNIPGVVTNQGDRSASSTVGICHLKYQRRGKKIKEKNDFKKTTNAINLWKIIFIILIVPYCL